PAVAGIGSSSVRYSHETRFTRETTGQYLAAAGGPVKLFSWSDPQDPYPRDALRVRPGQVRSLLVRAAAVDAPAAYQLYDLDRGGAVPLRVRGRSATTLSLAPARPLRPGRYAFVAAHEGMFGGRDFDYLTVVRPGQPVTAIASNPRGRARGRHGGGDCGRPRRPRAHGRARRDVRGEATGERRARRLRVPVGDRAQLVRDGLPRRRLGALDPPPAAHPDEPLDRRRRAR